LTEQAAERSEARHSYHVLSEYLSVSVSLDVIVDSRHTIDNIMMILIVIYVSS